MIIKKWICTVCLFLIANWLIAQQFSGTPANLHWRQIVTDTARIIYPEGEDSLAQRVAALVHYQQKHFSPTIGTEVHRINIVLRNELTYFNGYVGLGPFRSEYYLTPPQDAFGLGAQSVTDLLSIHEYRHVEQYNNFRKGLSKLAYQLFGQNGQALANDAAIPNWFFEGDAVYNETLLSQQGRGRLPVFFNGYKSFFYNNKQYSYMKLRNGSYKDYIPDHYPLGYMLVAYGREKYGDDFWRNVTDKAVRFKPLIYPLQNNVKALSGVPFRQFVHNAFSFYQSQWALQKKDSVSWITAIEKRNVVKYRYVYPDNNGGMILLKESYQSLPHFYHVDLNGRQQQIALQDITNDNYFSYRNGKIIYAAYQPDIRWSYREYSVIKVLDITTKNEQRINTKTRYFSPDISHDGKLIAAVSLSPRQYSSLDIIDIYGHKQASLTNNTDEIYSYPKFSADDKMIYFMVRKTNGEMSLQQWNMVTQETTVLLPFANRIIGFPQVQGDTLVYSCSNKGNDEIWAYVASQNKHYRMASFQTGLYGAAIINNKVVASVFTSSGYRLGKFLPEWQSVDISADTLVGLYVKKPFHTAANQTLEDVPVTNNYTSESYPRLSHPINFHSLQPDYSNPVFSLSLYGENILNTIQNQVYYNYNQNEGYNTIGYDLVYGVSYLQPYIDVSETFGRKAINNEGNRFDYNEANGIAGLQLPLNLSGGKSYRYLTASAAYGFNNKQFTGASKQVADNFTNGYLQTRLSYVSQYSQAFQQIFPHWAQSISLQYKRLVSASTASQFLLRGSLFLPGIFPSHSIVLNGAYETQTYQHSGNVFNYSLSDNFPYARGYSSFNFPTMYKAGINYHLPLAYPDFGIANIVYFRRLRANFFFDYNRIERTLNNQHYQYDLKSFGTEIYFDTKWWNQQNITLGLRYSHLLDYKTTGNQPNQWTLILPSSIFNN